MCCLGAYAGTKEQRPRSPATPLPRRTRAPYYPSNWHIICIEASDRLTASLVQLAVFPQPERCSLLGKEKVDPAGVQGEPSKAYSPAGLTFTDTWLHEFAFVRTTRGLLQQGVQLSTHLRLLAL